MAKSPIFDTSVFSPFKKQIEKDIAFSLLPSIVLYELTATSIDESTLKKYERWRKLLTKNERLLTPTANDWWETAKAIRRLYIKKHAPVTKLKTLQNDALIARLSSKTTVLSSRWMLTILKLSGAQCRNSKSFRAITFLVKNLYSKSNSLKIVVKYYHYFSCYNRDVLRGKLCCKQSKRKLMLTEK